MISTPINYTSIISPPPKVESKNHDKLFKDQETGVDLDVVEKVPLLEWLVENYKNYGWKNFYVF